MLTEQVLVTLLATAQLASGAALTGASFSLDQEDTGRYRFRNGFIETEATFEKFGMPVPDRVREAAAAAKTGSVAANPENFDKAYISPVDIGTPPQRLNLDFDTGSGDLWVFSQELPPGKRRGHATYKPKKSSTAKKLDGESWSIQYGDGSSASGDVYQDVVNIGGISASNQAVEAASQVSRSFAKGRVQDGLVGLSFSSINTVKPDKQTVFWDTVSGQLRKKVFASYLQKGKAGKYDFGFIDQTKFFGNINYKALAGNAGGFWRFDADGYAVGSTATNQTIDVIADTGTSLVYLPSGIVSDYYSAVQGSQEQQGLFFFPCSADLPNFSIILNGKRQIIPGNYINYAPAGQGFCVGGIQTSAGLPFGILGDVFLKSQYAVFDFGATRIGFGNQK